MLRIYLYETQPKPSTDKDNDKTDKKQGEKTPDS
jgi:hypothetical protein